MRVLVVAIAFTWLGLSGMLAAAEEVSALAIRAFNISPDDSAWAIIRATPFVLEVHDGSRVRRVALNGVDAISDVAPDPSIEWSADGKFVSVLYRSTDSGNSVEVYEAVGLAMIFKSDVGDAKWLKAGHRLIFIPAKVELGSLPEPGMLVFDARLRTARTIASDSTFDGAIATGTRYVIAPAASLRDGAIERRYVRVRVD